MRPDSVGSFAADIVGIAKQVLGIDLMPWQVIALGGQTAFGESGKLSHRISLVSVARQNGKTTALEALVAWYLIGRPKTHGKQEVVSSAHRFDLAQSLFTGLAPRLVEHYGATAKWSHGRESLRMPDGSTWVVKAARPSAGHGLHPDLIVVDEAWDVSSDVVDGGFLPTQRARPEPLLSMWSTAGTEDSKLLQRWREEGIRSIDTPGALFFAEWSPPSGSDDDDPRTWAYANPALGKTIDLERMREDSRNPNKSAFLRGYLNQWISAELAWLPPGLWPSLEVASSTDPGGLLAVESRKDESRYFLTRGRRVDDKVEVRLVGEYRSLLEVWEVITAELDADRDLRVLLAADLESSIPMSFARRVELTGRKELMAQTRFCRAMVGEGRVRHCGSATLADHVARAVAVETAAGYTLSASKSPGPIELARCLVWLVGKLGRDSRRERPTVVVARS